MITDPSGKTPPTYDYPGQSTPGYKFKKNGNGNGVIKESLHANGQKQM